jgi:hypothetical protein
MTALRIYTEATHYFTVRGDDGVSREYVRTPFEEWCTEIATPLEPELTRVQPSLAKQLENLFQESKFELA